MKAFFIVLLVLVILVAVWTTIGVLIGQHPFIRLLCVVYVPTSSGYLLHTANEDFESEGNLVFLDWQDEGYIAFQSDSRTIGVIQVTQGCRLG